MDYFKILGIILILIGFIGLFYTNSKPHEATAIELDKIPEEIGIENEAIKIQELGSLDDLILNKLTIKNSVINISYTFDNTNYIGEKMSVEIWIINQEGIETNRLTDSFFINKDNLIHRNILIKLPKKSLGNHIVFIALTSNLNNFIEESVFVGKSPITGNVISNISKGKGIPYTIFLVIIGIGVYVIFRKNKKTDTGLNKNEKIKSKPDQFFIRKT